MIELDLTKEKTITFDIQVEGIESKSLEGYIRFLVDNIEYGFPAEITNENIYVKIPPLNSKIGKLLKENDVLNARLDLYGNGYYIPSWSGDIRVKKPVLVEAKLSNENGPIVKVKSSINNVVKVQEKTKVVKENTKKKLTKKVDPSLVTESMIYNYMSKRGTKNPVVQKAIYEKISNVIGDNPKDILKRLIQFYNRKE